MVEIAIIQACNSDYVVKLLDQFEDEKYFYIVQEFIEGPNLLKHVLNRPRIENDIRNIAMKLFTGLEYLHSLGIGHRDIKFENIMVSSTENDATPKFIDFGLSKVFLYGEYSQERFGTLAYSSPQILMGQDHHLGVDIWSMGIMLYVLLSGTFPFLASDKNTTKRNIVFGKLNFN